jgi:hypothetical protein
MKEFVSAARKADDDDDGAIEFSVDGEEYTALPPTGGMLAVVAASQVDYTSDVERIGSVINFFKGVLDEDSRRRFTTRMQDREDDLDVEVLEEVLTWLMDQWFHRPTKPASGSTSSRGNGGRRSTAGQRSTGSTRSRSPQTASAT